MQTLKYIAIIAHNTFRESIRDKILYNIVFLAIALTLFSIVLGEWSVFDRAYVIKSTTLSVMSLSGLLISIFVGISLVQKEIQRRTVLTLLSKPISRVTFIVGKYFGLLAVVAVHLTLLTVIYYVMLFFTNAEPTASLLLAIYLIFCGALYAGRVLCGPPEQRVVGAGEVCKPHGRDGRCLYGIVREGCGGDTRDFPGALPLQRDELRRARACAPGYVFVLEHRLCTRLRGSIPRDCKLVV